MAAGDSLSVQLGLLAQLTAADVKDLATRIGTLTGLTTTQKGNLVSAINELKTRVDNAAAAAGATINDAASGTTTTYSSDKINAVIQQVKTDLLGGASAAFDTLKEIEARLGSDQTSLTNLLTAVAKRVAVDQAQAFTAVEKQQAIDNIGAARAVDVGDISTLNVAALYAAGKA